MKICSVFECERKMMARDWCSVHYAKWYRWGDPEYVYIKPKGSENGTWTGGRNVDAAGYVRLYLESDDPFFSMGSRTGGGSVYGLEHRIVMARHLGRPLLKGETVHHINGDRQDNRLDNLQLRVGQHGVGSALGCLDCGSHRIGPIPLKEETNE